jgi:transketolase
MIACRTIIGFGAPTRAGTRRRMARRWAPTKSPAPAKALDWPYPPFVVPNDILRQWREIGARGAGARGMWTCAQALQPARSRVEFDCGAGGRCAGHRLAQARSTN